MLSRVFCETDILSLTLRSGCSFCIYSAIYLQGWIQRYDEAEDEAREQVSSVGHVKKPMSVVHSVACSVFHTRLTASQPENQKCPHLFLCDRRY